MEALVLVSLTLKEGHIPHDGIGDSGDILSGRGIMLMVDFVRFLEWHLSKDTEGPICIYKCFQVVFKYITYLGCCTNEH